MFCASTILFIVQLNRGSVCTALSAMQIEGGELTTYLCLHDGFYATFCQHRWIARYGMIYILPMDELIRAEAVPSDLTCVSN